MPETKLHVTLLRHTLSPEEVVALGARLCYSRATLGDLEQKIAALDTQLAACGSDYVKLQDLTKEQDAAKTALDAAAQLGLGRVVEL